MRTILSEFMSIKCFLFIFNILLNINIEKINIRTKVFEYNSDINIKIFIYIFYSNLIKIYQFLHLDLKIIYPEYKNLCFIYILARKNAKS